MEYMMGVFGVLCIIVACEWESRPMVLMRSRCVARYSRPLGIEGCLWMMVVGYVAGSLCLVGSYVAGWFPSWTFDGLMTVIIGIPFVASWLVPGSIAFASMIGWRPITTKERVRR